MTGHLGDFATLSLVILMTSPACGGPSAKAPPVPETGSPVVARYAGGVVTSEDVREEVARLAPALRARFDSASGKAELARSVVDKRLLVQEARRRKLDQDPQVRRQVQELEERLIVQKLLADAEKSQAKPSEAELRAYFEAHASEFREPEKVRFSRILEAIPAHATEKDKVAATAAARRHLKQLEAGASFAGLARQGDGPERLRDGDYGFVARGELADRELERAVFAADRDKVVGPIACSDGIALVRVTDRGAGRLPPFEEVRPQVEARLLPMLRRRTFDETLERLRASSQIDVAVAEKK